MQTATTVRRVAIIGSPPGLGLSPTLLAASPQFHAEPARHRPAGGTSRATPEQLGERRLRALGALAHHRSASPASPAIPRAGRMRTAVQL